MLYQLFYSFKDTVACFVYWWIIILTCKHKRNDIKLIINKLKLIINNIHQPFQRDSLSWHTVSQWAWNPQNSQQSVQQHNKKSYSYKYKQRSSELGQDFRLKVLSTVCVSSFFMYHMSVYRRPKAPPSTRCGVDRQAKNGRYATPTSIAPTRYKIAARNAHIDQL